MATYLGVWKLATQVLSSECRFTWLLWQHLCLMTGNQQLQSCYGLKVKATSCIFSFNWYPPSQQISWIAKIRVLFWNPKKHGSKPMVQGHQIDTGLQSPSWKTSYFVNLYKWIPLCLNWEYLIHQLQNTDILAHFDLAWTNLHEHTGMDLDLRPCQLQDAHMILSFESTSGNRNTSLADYWHVCSR